MQDKIPELALDWIEAGRSVALATVVKTWGSAPRPVGAQLVIDAEMSFEGSVSGGCVESAVIFEAVEASLPAQSQLGETVSLVITDPREFF